MTIKTTPGYQLISNHYSDKTTARSQVPLINHINEGLVILERLGADLTTQEAYAVHPLFQNDSDLAANYSLMDQLDNRVVGYAIEYRNVANAFLSDAVVTGPNERGQEEIYPIRPLRLSPIFEVNYMLIADKVQNRKDFLQYHQATHARSRQLTFYFEFWLKALTVTDSQYRELVRDL